MVKEMQKWQVAELFGTLGTVGAAASALMQGEMLIVMLIVMWVAAGEAPAVWTLQLCPRCCVRRGGTLHRQTERREGFPLLGGWGEGRAGPRPQGLSPAGAPGSLRAGRGPEPWGPWGRDGARSCRGPSGQDGALGCRDPSGRDRARSCQSSSGRDGARSCRDPSGQDGAPQAGSVHTVDCGRLRAHSSGKRETCPNWQLAFLIECAWKQ